MHPFHIPGMTCGGCARRVTAAITALDDAAQVHIDLPAKRVTVESALPREQLAAALAQAGYAPEIAQQA
jgi:copper chaperone